MASRITRPSAGTLRWVERSVGRGAGVVFVRAVRVGSTSVHAVNVLDAHGVLHGLALRRFVDAERLGADPWYVPAHEVDVLELLERTPVRAPRLIAADLGPESCDVPTLLTTRIPGRLLVQPADMGSFLRQMAEELVVIHSVDDPGARELPRYARYYDGPGVVPRWARRPAVWERAFGVITEPPPKTPHRFIHRDYHQGNTLWLRGRLSGVVDWSTGCWGPSAIDLARMRQNLAGDFGLEHAERFLELYVALAGEEPEDLRCWELVDCADSLPDLGDPADEEELRGFLRFEQHVERVLDATEGSRR